MKHQVQDLSGSLLDRAVDLAQGFYSRKGSAPYSTSWAHGGPIIEREKISLLRVTQPGGDDEWLAWKMSGPTALVAAMRAYLASKIGEKVDLP